MSFLQLLYAKLYDIVCQLSHSAGSWVMCQSTLPGCVLPTGALSAAMAGVTLQKHVTQPEASNILLVGPEEGSRWQ